MSRNAMPLHGYTTITVYPHEIIELVRQQGYHVPNGAEVTFHTKSTKNAMERVEIIFAPEQSAQGEEEDLVF